MSDLSPRLTRRRALYIMGGAAGGLTLHACTQNTTAPTAQTSPAASPNETVKASNGSTLWIGFVPLYIAAEKGFFKENGLDLELKVFGTSGEGNSALAAGRVESINNVTSETVALASKDQNFRIVQIADSSKGGDGILARTSIQSIADFKGKEVAVEIGSVSHFFLLSVLEENGLTGEDVTLVNLSPDAAAAAYTAGRADIAVTYSPFLAQAGAAQKDGRVIFDSSMMPNAIMDVYLFSNKFIQEQPQAVEGFVRGIFQAKEFLQTNPDEALAIAGKKLELKPEEVAEELKGVELTTLEDNVRLLSDSSAEDSMLNHMNSLSKFLKAQNQIPAEIPTDQLQQLIDPTFVKAVQAKP